MFDVGNQGTEPSFELAVTATRSDNGTLSYQWYENTSNSATGGIVAGTNSNTLTLNKSDYTDSAKNGRHYFYVVVTNTISNNGDGGKKAESTTSQVATVIINGAGNVYLVYAQAPVIGTQPQGGTFDVEEDDTFPLTVGASVSDGGTLSYQWYSNTSNSTTGGSIMTGKTAATLTLDKDDYTSNGPKYFYVIVTNTITDNGDGGIKTATATSHVATVMIDGVGGVHLVNAAQPVIGTHPQSDTFDVGTATTHALTVTATTSDSGTLSYQWYSANSSTSTTDGTAIGTGSATLTLSKAAYTTNGSYHFYVIVTNTIADNHDGGIKTATATSNIATITVTGNGSPPLFTVPANVKGIWLAKVDTGDANYTGKKLTITDTEFSYDAGTELGFAGTIVNHRADGSDAGYITIQYTRSSSYAEAPGHFYVIHYKDITTTISISGADKTDEPEFDMDDPSATGGKSTKEAAETAYTVANRYFDQYSNFTKSTPLIADQWVNGYLPTGSTVDWYTITVSAGTTYRIWWNDLRAGPDPRPKTGDGAVGAWYANGINIFGDTNTTADHGWNTAESFTPTANGMVFVRVISYARAPNYVGTYGIVYSTSTTRPALIDTPVTFSNVTQNGSSETPTTEVTLTFDRAIPGLSAANITLSLSNPLGVVTKGNLSGSGPSYTLEMSSSEDGTLTVTVAVLGYTITGSPQTVGVYGGISANSPTPLVEDQWVNGYLPAASSIDWYTITVTAGTAYSIWWNDKGYNGGDGTKTGDVVVTASYADGTNIFGNFSSDVDAGWNYPRTITPTAAGIVYVQVIPYNHNGGYVGSYGIVYSTGNTRPETIDTPVTFNSVTANGSSETPTTALTLVFDKAIPELSAAHITLTMDNSFSVTKESLSASGTSYTLGISTPLDGTLTVAVAVPGYAITGSPQTVDVFGTDTPVTLSSVTANGSSGTATTELTLTFSEAIPTLAVSHITLANPFGVIKGSLSGDGPSYTLGVTVPQDGTLSVSVTVSGYAIIGSPKTVTIYGSEPPITITPLTDNTWANGTITAGTNNEDWYSFTAVAGTTYRVWWNGGFISITNPYGDGTKTLDTKVAAYYANGIEIFNFNQGWNSVQPFTPTEAQAGTIYLKVYPFTAGASGTYGIVFSSTSTTRPE
jgi:hypothetical protein